MSDPPDTIALRIDVDFPRGLTEAVPFFLDRLREAGMRATFFVVTGQNRSPLPRLLGAASRRRLWRLGPARVARRVAHPFASARFLDADASKRIVRRIRDEGSEIAVHGHDHAWWADHAWSAAPGRLIEEIDRAFGAVAGLTGPDPLAWGSPAWRTTEPVLQELARREVPYFADCWGACPFLTADAAGGIIPVPHLPITLPSLETLMLEERLAARAAVVRLVGGHVRGGFDLACLHDYFEGLLFPELFEMLLDALRERGTKSTTLAAASASLLRDGRGLPAHRLTRGTVSGFVGACSFQGDAIRDTDRALVSTR